MLPNMTKNDAELSLNKRESDGRRFTEAVRDVELEVTFVGVGGGGGRQETRRFLGKKRSNSRFDRADAHKGDGELQ